MNFIYVHPEQYYSSETQSVSGYKRWNVRRRADGINETFKSKTGGAVRTGTGANNLSALPVVLTVQGGMGTSGGDTVLDYYDPDGVNDYIGPTLSATQMNTDGYGRALSYDNNAFVFKAGDAVGIWVCTKDGSSGIPLIGWGNCFNGGCGIFWNPSSTSGTLSAIVDDYEYETIPYSQLRWTSGDILPYWNYILWDSATGKVFINGEEAAYRVGSYGYDDGSSGDSRKPGGNPPVFIETSNHGWLPTPDQIGSDSNQDWEDYSSPGSMLEYLEIGRAMKDKAESSPPWTFSSYVKATTNTFFGEVHIWAQSTEGIITRGPESSDQNFVESTARYFYNTTLSAGQLGYYHAQTL